MSKKKTAEAEVAIPTEDQLVEMGMTQEEWDDMGQEEQEASLEAIVVEEEVAEEVSEPALEVIPRKTADQEEAERDANLHSARAEAFANHEKAQE